MPRSISWRRADRCSPSTCSAWRSSRGCGDPSVLQRAIPLDLTAIFWYNALHLVFSLTIGLVVVRLLTEAVQRPGRARGVLVILVAGFLVTVLAVAQLTEPIRGLLPFWSIVLANALAVFVVGRFLVKKHPGIWRTLMA